MSPVLPPDDGRPEEGLPEDGLPPEEGLPNPPDERGRSLLSDEGLPLPLPKPVERGRSLLSPKPPRRGRSLLSLSPPRGAGLSLLPSGALSLLSKDERSLLPKELDLGSPLDSPESDFLAPNQPKPAGFD